MNTEKTNIMIRFFIEQSNAIFKCDLLDRTRTRNNVNGRAAIAHELRKKGMSYIQIGRVIGKDHASALYSERKHHDYMKVDKGYRDKYMEFLVSVTKPLAREKVLIPMLEAQQSDIINELYKLGYDRERIAMFMTGCLEQLPKKEPIYEF